MKILLECGEYVRVTKVKNHPKGVKGNYVLEFDLDNGFKFLRKSKADARNEIEKNGNEHFGYRQIRIINELMNSDDRFYHNIYLNTSVN